MGYHKLPSYYHYWSTDQDLSVPLVASTMPRNRFQQILSNLHINDNAMMPAHNTDKLFKLRPMISRLNDNYVKLYNVSKTLSIDESMILFKGRSSLKQYNPKKPIKRGYKLWMRADMDGYITKFDVYQGKSGQKGKEDAYPGIGLGERVIVDLTKDLFGKNHQVYFDNYFSAVPLVEHLKANGVQACGTIRPDRKYLPTNLMSEKSMERGQADYRVSDQDITFFKWMDNRAVHVISNFHGTELGTIKRTQKDGTKKDFSCPIAIREYNEQMGGVDKADMLCAVYGIGRKSKKWWHRIFFGLVDRTLVNAAIAHNKMERDNMSLLNFRRSVAQSLMTLCRKPKAGRSPKGTPPSVVSKRRRVEYSVSSGMRLQNRGAHWPTYSKLRGRCEVCSKQGIESRPHCKCSMCGVFLCSNEKKIVF